MSLSETADPHQGTATWSETVPTSYFDDMCAYEEQNYTNDESSGGRQEQFLELLDVYHIDGKDGLCICARPECVGRSLGEIQPLQSFHDGVDPDTEHFILCMTNSDGLFSSDETLLHHEPLPNGPSISLRRPARNTTWPIDVTAPEEQTQEQGKVQFESASPGGDLQVDKKLDEAEQHQHLSMPPETSSPDTTLTINRTDHSIEICSQPPLNTYSINSAVESSVPQWPSGLNQKEKDFMRSSRDRIYSCTNRVCSWSFKTKYHWERHELNVHWRNGYLCMECNVAINDSHRRSICGFCFAVFSSDGDVKKHILSCDDALAAKESFKHRDQLMVHLIKKHDVQRGDKRLRDMDRWFYCFERKWPKQCGFCGEIFNAWKKRVDHVARHFREGRLISEWTLPFFQACQKEELESQASQEINNSENSRNDGTSYHTSDEKPSPQIDFAIPDTSSMARKNSSGRSNWRESNFEIEEYYTGLYWDINSSNHSICGSNTLERSQQLLGRTNSSSNKSSIEDGGYIREVLIAAESSNSFSPAMVRFLEEDVWDGPINIMVALWYNPIRALIPDSTTLANDSLSAQISTPGPTILGKRKRYQAFERSPSERKLSKRIKRVLPVINAAEEELREWMDEIHLESMPRVPGPFAAIIPLEEDPLPESLRYSYDYYRMCRHEYSEDTSPLLSHLGSLARVFSAPSDISFEWERKHILHSE
ncbi:hypothetical protein F5884DRAFT_259977 [Xylogone sp. PMI_703]|nr:hypothetical protein F5884DRAFT_259977 [Xylogone sp. PMI_703]